MQAATGRRPLDALGDLPGDPNYDLTRAVIVYRRSHQLWEEKPSDRDWGLGLVVDGSYPMAADVVDLGSGRRYLLDLERLVAVVDWVATETVQHVDRLLGASAVVALDAARADPQALESYCEALGLEVLRRAGVDPLTRAPLLRIGFRDIVRDVEMGDDGEIRIGVSGRTVRVRLDADLIQLRIDAGAGFPELDRALAEAFEGEDVRATGPGGHQVRFALPTTYLEMENVLRAVRRGVLHLLAYLEPERYRSTLQLTRTLGSRSTLHRLFGGPAPARSDASRLSETG